MNDNLSYIDPNQIEGTNLEPLRRIVISLMNRVETLEAIIVQQKAEIQHLKDENARLKGEKGNPQFKANTKQKQRPAPTRSSRKGGKPGPDRATCIEIDQRETVEVKQKLPPDARFVGYRDVVVQDLVFARRSVAYRLKRYFSALTGRFYEAVSPAQGHRYGASLRAFVLMAYYQLRIPQGKIVELLRAKGVVIRAGAISLMLTEQAECAFSEDYQAIVAAGVATSRHQHIDHTGLRQAGVGHQVAVLCTKAYGAFFINRHRNKRAVRDLLRPVLGSELADHVSVLVSDKAGEFLAQPVSHQACWIHEIRHYKTLKGAYFREFRQEQAAFLDRLYGYYDRLRRWRASPHEAEAWALAQEFDDVFSGQGIAFEGLRKRIALTRASKSELLLCLTDGSIPLENNEAERSLREVVLKRKISYGTRGEAGSRAWSVMLTLVETARKQGVEVYAYLYDRLSGERAMPSLAECILEQAAQPALATA